MSSSSEAAAASSAEPHRGLLSSAIRVVIDAGEDVVAGMESVGAMGSRSVSWCCAYWPDVIFGTATIVALVIATYGYFTDNQSYTLVGGIFFLSSISAFIGRRVYSMKKSLNDLIEQDKKIKLEMEKTIRGLETVVSAISKQSEDLNKQNVILAGVADRMQEVSTAASSEIETIHVTLGRGAAELATKIQMLQEQFQRNANLFEAMMRKEQTIHLLVQEMKESRERESQIEARIIGLLSQLEQVSVKLATSADAIFSSSKEKGRDVAAMIQELKYDVEQFAGKVAPNANRGVSFRS